MNQEQIVENENTTIIVSFNIYGERIIYSTLNDKLHGKRKTWNKEGLLRKSETYLHGVLHGEHSIYFSDGTLRIRSSRLYGELDGKYESWYSDGSPQIKTMYQNGRLHGQRIIKNGQHLIKRANYSHGKRHGDYEKYTYDSGIPHKICHYEEDKIQGYYTKWYENGQIHTKCYYENGQIHGRSESWSESGKLIELSQYQHGKLHGKCFKWNDDGTETRHHYSLGKLLSTKTIFCC